MWLTPRRQFASWQFELEGVQHLQKLRSSESLPFPTMPEKPAMLRKDSALLFRKSERIRASCALSTIKKVQDRELDMYLEKHGFTDMNSPIEVDSVKDRLLPIHVATLHAEDEAVRMLLTYGADPEAQTIGGRSALDIAQNANIGRSHLQVLQLLRGAVQIVEVKV